MKERIEKIIEQTRSFVQKRWKLILIVIVVIGGIIIWRAQATPTNQSELTFEHPVYRDLSKKLEVSGVVDADEKASMRFAAGGKVVYLGAHEGDLVKKYQTIATIDQRELQKRLQQDLNMYMQERWDWEGLQDEYNYTVEDLETRRMLDKEQWSLTNEVLDVEIRDIAISNTYLTAPFTGVLVSSPTDVTGVTLLPSDTFELINPDSLVFKAGVDEADIAQLQASQSAQIFLDAYRDEPINTTVSYISYTSSNTSSGTVFLVKFPIQGENLLGKYRIGMNGDVSITIDTKTNVLTIPYAATRIRDDKTYVDVRTEGEQYEARQIETGLETDEYIEVISGLSSEDEILIPEN